MEDSWHLPPGSHLAPSSYSRGGWGACGHEAGANRPVLSCPRARLASGETGGERALRLLCRQRGGATGQDAAFPLALGGVCISLETLSCMTDRPCTG